MRSALAEMGYGYAQFWLGHNEGGPCLMHQLDDGVPSAVWWQAIYLAGLGPACWSCLERRSGDAERDAACRAGRCGARLDEAKVPPREMLVRR